MKSPRLKVSAGAVCLGCLWLALSPVRLFLSFLCSVLLHELGHWLVLKACGFPLQRLRITALGCMMETPPLPYRIEGICALAGPAVNLLLFALSLHRDAGFSLVNLALAVFNLLPLWHLDGGRFLRAVLQELLAPVPACAIEFVISRGVLGLLWLCAIYGTCVLHMGLGPALLAAVLTGKAAGENLVAKKQVCG